MTVEQAEKQLERLERLEIGEGDNEGVGRSWTTAGGAGHSPIRPGDGLPKLSATNPLFAKAATHPERSVHSF